MWWEEDRWALLSVSTGGQSTRRSSGRGCVCVVGVLKADTVLVYVVMKMMQKNGEGAS